MPNIKQIALRFIKKYQFARFMIVGCANTSIDLLILNTLVFIVGFRVLPANFISAFMSIILSYFLNHLFVFRENRHYSFASFGQFLAITGLSIILVQTAVIYVVTNLFTPSIIIMSTGLSQLQAQFVSINSAKSLAVLFGMIWNFSFYKFVVFRRLPVAQEATSTNLV